jgi:uncharacterized protein YndB with AHSA1/START domain
MNDLSLQLTKEISAPPDKVYDAWLDPATLQRFMLTGGGAGVKSVKTDPIVGGRFDIVMTNEMGEVPHWGEYRVLDRPQQIVFTWNSPHASPDSLVTLTFEPTNAGTLLTLVHEKFPSEDSLDGHTNGWTAILATLAETFS